MNTADIAAVEKALMYLAGVCDGALSRDDHGFNRFDTQFGTSLAERVAAGVSLSENQAYAVLRMLQKYRGQIERAGLTLPSYTNVAAPVQTPGARPPVANVDRSNIRIVFENGAILIYFNRKPDQATLDKVRNIPGRKWLNALPGLPWSIPVESAPFVIAAFPESCDENIRKLAGDAPIVEIIERAERAPTVLVKKHNGTILVYFPNPIGRKERVEMLKALPERRWKPDLEDKPWEVPNRFAIDIVTMFPDAVIDDTVKAFVETQRELRSLSNQAEGHFEVPGLGGVLYPFQEVGVQFLETANGRALIADQMGLGKTVQAAAYLQYHPELRPAVIVCPASLKINWRRELNRWLTTNKKIAVLEGQKPFDPALINADIWLINWDVLSYWKDVLIKARPAVVIMDEAHFAKNHKAQRSKAAHEICKVIERVILLTGTPVTNRPAELFPLVNMVDPAGWPNFYRFAIRYCQGGRNQYGFDASGASNLEELHDRIKPYVIRRTKDQVLKDLPPKARRTLVMGFDEKYRPEYEEMLEHARDEANKSSAAALVFIEKAKQITVKAKLADAIQWIENFIETDKLVLFATHTEPIGIICKHFGKQAVRVTGAESYDERQVNVDAFQNDDTVRLFVGNIKAAGVGLTLTAASDVAFIEFPWTPGDADQAEDRLHRIGQTDSVTAWYLVAENTIDEDIVSLMEAKRKNIDVIHDGKVGELDFSIVGELIAKIKKGFDKN